MRVLPLAARGVAVMVVLAVAVTPPAGADEPSDESSAGAIQVKLVQSRMHLNDLYARAAAASERLNGATYEAQQAEESLRRQRAAVARAEKQLARQREVVAALTVQQLQNGSGTARLSTLFESDGPQQLLERAGAYTSTGEAMTARVDAFAARQVVRDAAVRRAEEARARQAAALKKQQTASRQIDAAIAAAEDAVSSQERERSTLLRRLASVQHVPLAQVERRQDRIDARIDASGPDAGAVVAPPTAAAPDPAPRPSAKPKPTTAPKPPPTTPQPPPADPPPASGNAVETAIAFAKAQLGEPYKYGADGPSSWDCSGLTMRAWQAAGVSLPHYAGAQYANTRHVAVSNIRRGDLIYWSNGGPSSIYHVAIYLGGGQMIQAPRTGRNVEIVPLSYWIQPDLASRPG